MTDNCALLWEQVKKELLTPQRIFMKSPWENAKILKNVSHISLDQCHKWNCIIQSLS